MSAIKATYTDTIGNTETMNINTATGKIWLVNQNNTPLCFSNVMFMRNDLNGWEQEARTLLSAVKNVTSKSDLVQILNKETKLNWE